MATKYVILAGFSCDKNLRTSNLHLSLLQCNGSSVVKFVNFTSVEMIIRNLKLAREVCATAHGLPFISRLKLLAVVNYGYVTENLRGMMIALGFYCPTEGTSTFECLGLDAANRYCRSRHATGLPVPRERTTSILYSQTGEHIDWNEAVREMQ